MQDRQRIIVEWMQAMLAKHGISARRWADIAKVGKDTVSRAMREQYEWVTSSSTIAKLAEALNEKPIGAAAAIPSAMLLADLVRELSVMIPGARPLDEEVLLVFAKGLRDTLLMLADETDAVHDTKLATALARVAARRLDHPNA